MTKYISILLIFFCFLSLVSCSEKAIKNLSPDEVGTLFENEGFGTLVKENSVKSDDPLFSMDYTVTVVEDKSSDQVYFHFFADDKTAENYIKESEKHSGAVFIFGLIFGESVNIKYKRYGNIVAEYEKNKSTDRKLDIFESAVYS